MRKLLPAVTVVLLLGAPRLSGQDVPRQPLRSWSPSLATERASAKPATPVPAAVRMGVAGVVGGVTGAYLGRLIGAELAQAFLCDDGCLLINEGTGWVAGEAIGIPLTVHLANGSRGSFAADLVLSAAAGGAMLVLVNAAHERALVWLVPVSQIASAIWAERVSAAHRVQDRADSDVP